MTIDCREAVRRMWAYLERALERPEADELDVHLETCKRCCGELELARHLRALVAESERHEPMPPELRARIELLLAGGPSADPGAGGGR
ncbi:MAG TPA: zf-HC2 domain-containing protein [Candidatus Limnocylindrales bacterium]|nr:zf-HC2 domain-containing protein [Candidatus Limnocylindrales bacterium]